MGINLTPHWLTGPQVLIPLQKKGGLPFLTPLPCATVAGGLKAWARLAEQQGDGSWLIGPLSLCGEGP